MTNSTDIRPFRIEIPQTDLDDLHDRLARTRWTEELPDAGSDYGVTGDYVRRLATHWLHSYDWRAWEDNSTPSRSSPPR